MKPFFTIAFFLLASLSISAQSTEQNSSEQTAMVYAEQMYYIHITESKNDRELFPKLYPIGFVIKEQNPKNNRTMYFLGEFATKQEADEALSEVKASGYTKAYVVKK